MYKKIVTRFTIISFLVLTTIVEGMNITRPYESLIRAEYCSNSCFDVAAIVHASFSDAKGFNEDGCKVNVLRIWDEQQDALKMLDGFAAETEIGQRRVLVNTNDDGVRGHFLVDGDLSAYGFSLVGRWLLPKNFSVVTYIPFYFMQLKGVTWQDQTRNITADDARTKEYLTNDFFANVRELGEGLELGSWKRYGIGDIYLMLELLQDFKQSKPFLKNVCINARGGVGFPSGKCRGEDNIFALPFGNDGGFSFLFGGGLDLTLGTYIKAGFDVELQHVFGSSRCRRIKTDLDQTELLLLAKTEVFKDFGLSQRFSLYLQGCEFFGGLSCTAGYQFFRHGDDTLSVFDHTYSQEIANTSKSLEEWTMHNLFFSLNYNFGCCENEEKSSVHPYLSIFTKIPFNGRSSALVNTVGLVLSLDF